MWGLTGIKRRFFRYKTRAGLGFGVGLLQYVVPKWSESETVGIEDIKTVRLSCLDSQMISSVRASGDTGFALLKCLDELKKGFGPNFKNLSDSGWRAILATTLAANFAEYGQSSAIKFSTIANSDYLNCGNLVLLTGYLYDSSSKKLRTIGFEGGAIGNHARVYYDGKVKMLLDPTVGLVVLVTFNDLLQGEPVPPEKNAFSSN